MLFPSVACWPGKMNCFKLIKGFHGENDEYTKLNAEYMERALMLQFNDRSI